MGTVLTQSEAIRFLRSAGVDKVTSEVIRFLITYGYLDYEVIGKRACFTKEALKTFAVMHLAAKKRVTENVSEEVPA